LRIERLSDVGEFNRSKVRQRRTRAPAISGRARFAREPAFANFCNVKVRGFRYGPRDLGAGHLIAIFLMRINYQITPQASLVDLESYRRYFATFVLAYAGIGDERSWSAFAATPRERFAGSGATTQSSRLAPAAAAQVQLQFQRALTILGKVIKLAQRHVLHFGAEHHEISNIAVLREPWYPTSRLFRQGVSSTWEATLARVFAQLESTINWSRTRCRDRTSSPK